MPWDPMHAWPAGRRWLWAALAVLVASIQGPAFVASLRPARDQGVDFFQEWASARSFLDGGPVYGNLEEAVERYLGYEVHPDSPLHITVNAHPPTSVLLALPFAALAYPDAVFVWNLLSVAGLAVSLWLVGRELRLSFPLWAALPTLTLLLTCFPFREQIAQGQLSLLLLLLLTAVWVSQRSGRHGWAGVFLGAATVLKLYPAFVLLYFVVRRQWKAVTATIITCAVLTGLTLCAFGPQTYRGYAQRVLPSLEQFRGWHENASLTGFFTRLFDPPVPSPNTVPKLSSSHRTSEEESPKPSADGVRAGMNRPVVVNYLPILPIDPLWRSPALARWASSLACVALILSLVWVVRRARTRTESDFAFGGILIGMILVSPIAWSHSFLVLLVPITLTWVHLPSSSLARGLFLVIVGVLWLDPAGLTAFFIPLSWEAGRPVWGNATPVHTLTVLAVPTYALLALLGFGIAVGRRLPPTSSHARADVLRLTTCCASQERPTRGSCSQ